MGWLATSWSQVWPNLLASALWGLPAFIAHHLLLRKHVNRKHDQLCQFVHGLLFPDDASGVDDR